MRVETIDLRFQGQPHVIAAFVVRAPEGPVLIETGPSSTLPALLAGLAGLGIEPGQIRDVLVTHIHLDHAGGAGWWAGRGARVWVHEVGAPHLVDPSKLIRSATRIYGEKMDTLWGEILAAPAEQLRVVRDGDRLEIAGLEIEAIDAPGHATHHHVFRIDKIAFTGDAAGIRLPGERWIDLPAPPPEFDADAWTVTLDRLRALELETIYRTHFGGVGEVRAELDRFEASMTVAVGWMAEMVDRGLDRDAMIGDFSSRMRDRAIASGLTPEDARAYELANPRVMSVDGISRYLRKRARE